MHDLQGSSAMYSMSSQMDAVSYSYGSPPVRSAPAAVTPNTTPQTSDLFNPAAVQEQRAILASIAADIELSRSAGSRQTAPASSPRAKSDAPATAKQSMAQTSSSTAGPNFMAKAGGPWKYLVLDTKGIYLQAKPSHDEEDMTGWKVDEGEVVTVTERKKVGATTFLKLERPAAWACDRLPGSKAYILRMMEVVVETGTWHYRVVAEKGIAYQTKCSTQSSCKAGVETLQKGALMAVNKRVVAGETAFVQVPGKGWLFDFKQGYRTLEGPCSLQQVTERTIGRVLPFAGLKVLAHPTHERWAQTWTRMEQGTEVEVKSLMEAEGVSWVQFTFIASPSDLNGGARTSMKGWALATQLEMLPASATQAKKIEASEKRGGEESEEDVDPLLQAALAMSLKEAAVPSRPGAQAEVVMAPTPGPSPSSAPPSPEAENPWVINDERLARYEAAFRKQDADQDGYVTGMEAKEVLEKTRLPGNELGHIWHMSDVDRDGKLSGGEFVCAMHLAFRRWEGAQLPQELPVEMRTVAMGALRPAATQGVPGQRSVEPNKKGLEQDQIAANLKPPPLPPPAHPPPEEAEELSSSPSWTVPGPEELARYFTIFKTLEAAESNRNLSATPNAVSRSLGPTPEVREVFEKSSLSTADLSAIWRMSDVDGDGRLSADEFACAMAITRQRKLGLELPKGPLAPPLFQGLMTAEAARRRGMAATPPTTPPQAVAHTPSTATPATETTSPAQASAPDLSVYLASPEEFGRYLAIFATLKVPPSQSVDGTVGQAEAKDMFERSGIPPAELGHLWTISDFDGDGRLCAPELLCAMTLVGRRRSGFPIPPSLPRELRASAVAAVEQAARARCVHGSDPSFSGQPSGRNNGDVPHNDVAVTPSIPASPPPAELSCSSLSSPWALTEEELDRYSRVSRALDTAGTGYADTNEARKVLERSKLPTPELSAIWRLSDADADGKLSNDEFICAMALVHRRRQGVQLPDRLPPELLRRPLLQAPSSPVVSAPSPAVAAPSAVYSTPPDASFPSPDVFAASASPVSLAASAPSPPVVSQPGFFASFPTEVSPLESFPSAVYSTPPDASVPSPDVFAASASPVSWAASAPSPPVVSQPGFFASFPTEVSPVESSPSAVYSTPPDASLPSPDVVAASASPVSLAASPSLPSQGENPRPDQWGQQLSEGMVPESPPAEEPPPLATPQPEATEAVEPPPEVIAELPSAAFSPPTPKISSTMAPTTAEMERYLAIWNAKCPDATVTGKMGGKDAKEVLELSRLPTIELSAIWRMSDADGDSRFSMDEFITAMTLIGHRLKGLPLPTSLPEELKQRPIIACDADTAGKESEGGDSSASGGDTPERKVSDPETGPGIVRQNSGFECYFSKTPKGEDESATFGMGDEEDSAPTQERCACGTVFMPCAALCRDCGAKRTMPEAAMEESPSASPNAELSPRSGSPSPSPPSSALPPLSEGPSERHPAQEPSSPSVWTPQPGEWEKYRAIFAVIIQDSGVNAAAPGVSAGPQEARAVFEKSNLPTSELSRIWRMSDVDMDGRLTLDEFVCAMSIVARRLKGIEIPAAIPPELRADVAATVSHEETSAPMLPASLPAPPENDVSIAYAAPPVAYAAPPVAEEVSVAYAAPLVAYAAPPVAEEATRTVPQAVWAISSEEMERYQSLFRSIDPSNSGSIGPSEGRAMLERSKLPKDDLMHIWELADVDEDGRLTLGEFLVAMCLVSRKLQGIELPGMEDTLPPELAKLVAAVVKSPSPSPAEVTASSNGAHAHAAEAPLSPAPGARDPQDPLSPPPTPWAISEEELQRYGAIFAGLSPEVVDSSASVPQSAVLVTKTLEVLARSKLPEEELRRALAVVGIPQASEGTSSVLSLPDFICLMALVTRRLQGAPFPDELPPDLRDAASSGSSSIGRPAH